MGDWEAVIFSFLSAHNDNISFKESCIARHNDFEVDLYDQDKIVKQSYQNMSCSMKQSMGRKIFAL